MKKITDLIDRPKCLLTGKDNMEALYTIKDLPVFMGCVETPPEEDLCADEEWQICPETGLIQLGRLLPLDILYLNQHNDGIGKLWQDHYLAFAQFLAKFKPKNILEIGAGNDAIAKYFLDKNPETTWTAVEPHPQFIADPRVKIVTAWFDDKFKLDTTVDTVVHSHVLEHTYDPFAFIEHISTFLKPGDRHIFTFPNLLAMIQNKYTNGLNFEHTVFLTEDITDYVLTRSGFKILEKQYFGDGHSIFYATEKRGEVPVPPLPNKYAEYKRIFLDFIDYHRKIIDELNSRIESSAEPIYLFGAHIFSQFLLSFGLKSAKIMGILDNSLPKQGKRLYGTNFTVSSPEVLAGKGRINVILKAGSYNDEIKKQLLTINPDITVW